MDDDELRRLALGHAPALGTDEADVLAALRQLRADPEKTPGSEFDRRVVDTNVLVYASDTDAPEHARARALLEHLAAGPDLVVVVWPRLLGYLRIVTHPSTCAAPLSFEVARANVDALLALPHVRAAADTGEFWSAFTSVAADVPVRGNLVPDAQLVALWRTHGVRHIWSRDRDLRRFDAITVTDPFDDRYTNGFPRR